MVNLRRGNKAVTSNPGKPAGINDFIIDLD
jgi:hypothetical protein